MVELPNNTNIKLAEEDKRVAGLLMNIGVPRNVARTVTYLSKVPEALSVQIEVGAELRQPEVSIAIRKMRERNWISERKIKKEGKGRPLHTYKMNSDIKAIVNTLIQEKKNELSLIERDLVNLINVPKN